MSTPNRKEKVIVSSEQVAAQFAGGMGRATGSRSRRSLALGDRDLVLGAIGHRDYEAPLPGGYSGLLKSPDLSDVVRGLYFKVVAQDSL
jgi:hypothetical protein